MPRTGRPREFDVDEVVRTAMGLFWERGYEATSVQDLVDGLGLQRGSLYGAFGDKRTLFLRALDAYTSVATTLMHGLAADGPVLPRLRAFLLQAADPTAAPRGCLMGNSAVELAGTDEAVADAVAAGFAASEQGLRAALERAYDTGELPRADSAAQAGYLLALLQGLHVVSRTHPSSQWVGRTVDAALAGLQSCGSPEHQRQARS